ncbi:MAG: tryptophan synthase subunit beta, partial [Fusobacterium sp.]
ANVGVFQGMKSILLTDENGNIIPAHSISAGLDYPGVGPEHAYLKSIDRAVYKSITDEEALVALKELSSVEGIIPAIESSHAVALALKEIGTTTKDDIIIINISGRGDKDMNTIMDYYENNDIHKLNK